MLWAKEEDFLELTCRLRQSLRLLSHEGVVFGGQFSALLERCSSGGKGEKLLRLCGLWHCPAYGLLKLPAWTKGSISPNPYECSVPLYDKFAQATFHQGYYLWGLLLLFFDIEAAFLFPWTVVYKHLGVFGFMEMFLLIFILTYGLLYAWRKGAFDWQLEEEYI